MTEFTMQRQGKEDKDMRNYVDLRGFLKSQLNEYQYLMGGNFILLALES